MECVLLALPLVPALRTPRGTVAPISQSNPKNRGQGMAVAVLVPRSTRMSFPAGFRPSHLFAASAALPYTIEFQNEPAGRFSRCRQFDLLTDDDRPLVRPPGSTSKPRPRLMSRPAWRHGSSPRLIQTRDRFRLILPSAFCPRQCSRQRRGGSLLHDRPHWRWPPDCPNLTAACRRSDCRNSDDPGQRPAGTELRNQLSVTNNGLNVRYSN